MGKRKQEPLDPPYKAEMIAKLRGELGEAQERTEFYKRELRDYRRIIVQHGQSLSELRANLAAAQRHAMDMEAGRDSAVRALREVERQRDFLEGRREALEGERDSAVRALQEAALPGREADLSEQCSRLVDQLERARSERDAFREMLRGEAGDVLRQLKAERRSITIQDLWL